MENLVITKAAVEALIEWTIQEFGQAKLPEKKKVLRVSFVGFRRVDVVVDILVKAGNNIIETADKFHQKLKTTLEKLAGLELRQSKIKVKGLYYDPVEKQDS